MSTQHNTPTSPKGQQFSKVEPLRIYFRQLAILAELAELIQSPDPDPTKLYSSFLTALDSIALLKNLSISRAFEVAMSELTGPDAWQAATDATFGPDTRPEARPKPAVDIDTWLERFLNGNPTAEEIQTALHILGAGEFSDVGTLPPASDTFWDKFTREALEQAKKLLGVSDE